MRIELDIPDWLIGEGRQTRGIFVMAGIEPVAIKLPDQPWQVKTGRCTNCGKCCEGWRETDMFPPQHDGKCDYLAMDGPKKICSLGLSRPFACTIAINARPGCTATWESMNGSS